LTVPEHATLTTPPVTVPEHVTLTTPPVLFDLDADGSSVPTASQKKVVVFANDDDINAESSTDPEIMASELPTQSINTSIPPPEAPTPEPPSIASLGYWTGKLEHFVGILILLLRTYTIVYDVRESRNVVISNMTRRASEFRRSSVLLHDFTEALILFMATRTHWFCYIMCIVCAIQGANLLSAVYPIMMLCWGIPSRPLPSRRFWTALIWYTTVRNCMLVSEGVKLVMLLLSPHACLLHTFGYNPS
jgi:hypothetical protein